MVQEKKVQANLTGDELHMTLLVPRTELEGYERDLVDGLFFEGDRTSIGEIRSHYESPGFDPVRIIQNEVRALAEAKLPKGEIKKASGALPTMFFFGAIAALVYAVLQRRDMLTTAGLLFLAAFFVTMFAALGPEHWRKNKQAGVPLALLSMVPAAFGVGLAAYVIWRSEILGTPDLSFEMQLAVTLLALWSFITAVWALLSRESRESFAMRRMLTAAREFFRNELTKPQPALDDAWYPYVLAFGLGSEAEKWFREFGSTSSGSRFSTPPSWSGGEASFSGTGVPGAWTAAISRVAMAIAPEAIGIHGDRR